VDHPDAVVWDQAGCNFIDVLCGADAFITKPGYGSFAEAACNGVRTLYIPRGDWPEERCLVDWLPRQVPCASITREQFAAGDFVATLSALLDAPRPRGREPTGIAEAADVVQELLAR
jgi:hypothetical protein